MLTGINQQIVTAYETLEMSAAQISHEFDLDEVSVKACLLQFSAKFRTNTKKLINNDFNDDELIEANQVIVSLMRNSEDEYLRGRMARYVRDDKKGRLDTVGVGKINVNITLFNERLLQAREAVIKSKQLTDKPNPPLPASLETMETIDVESERELVER